VVRPTASGTEALRCFAHDPPDVFVLGIGLPDADGRDVCQALRARGVRSPVPFLSARDGVTDCESGFHAGGDDYLTKPFALAELLVRVHALVRRADPPALRGRQGLVLDPAEHAIVGDDAHIALTPTEFRLLATLAARPGRLVRRSSLRAAGWPEGAIVHDNTLDAYVARIRRKLREAGAADAIATTRGVGYRLASIELVGHAEPAMRRASSEPHRMSGDSRPMKVLIVDDEVKLATLVRRGLQEEGMVADIAGRGEDALRLLAATAYDAIVLDVMLPGIDGFEVCRRLREDGVWSPVIMLTARDAIEDRVTGLDGGADDYLAKPFSLAELVARLRGLARRGAVDLPVVLQVGDLRLDAAMRRVWHGDTEIALSVKEYALLETFMRRPGQVLDRFQLLEHAWGTNTTTAPTSSTSTCTTCARRSTGRSASSRSRRSAAPATASEPTARAARSLAAAVDDHEVGDDARREAAREQDQADLAVPEAAHAVPDLADDIEDRAARQGVERELERLGGDAVADHRPDERRAAADEPGKQQPAPRGPDITERADDAEALGRVVQREADDQDGREPDLVGLRRDADGQPFREVV
jgi:two-component system, OmpR family, response regulator